VGLAKYFKETFVANGGTVAIEQKYSEGDKDFKAQLTAIKAAGVDLIFVPGYYTEAALIARQARELGLTIPLAGGDGWEAPQLIEIGGTAVEGTYKTPAVLEFVKKFQARWGGETPDAMAALGYDSAQVLANAIRRAGTTAGDKVRDALAVTSGFDGVTGKTTIDASRNASKSAVIITVRNGRFDFLQEVTP
jgi:branched-chain amino acid transport system substrate-binding protein